MYNLDTEQLISLLIALVIVLAIMLLFVTVMYFVYKSKCDHLELENFRLRRTIKGQSDLRFASNAAYQEMLNAAFGNRRID